jgi:hypothetical protein
MDSITNLTSNNKNDILDPLSIIIKMFIYAFKPVGTKISIGYNKLCIQENTYIQGAWRKWNGDTKNDINILLCPILYACIHYLKNETNFKTFAPIFKTALEGLTNMKQTYSGTAIIYNIEHIVNIINLFLHANIAEDSAHSELPQHVLEDNSMVEVNSIINTDTPIYKMKENIYHHLNSCWTTHRKNILFGYVKEILEVNNVGLKVMLIDGLTKFMECMDTIVANVLLNNRI